MNKMKFKTYELSEHNPFNQLSEGKLIALEADEEGLYSIHIRFKNGLGLTSKEKVTLHKAVTAALYLIDDMGLSVKNLWLDLPNHVLEEPGILNRKLKDMMTRKGLYWKASSH